jgi:hypothetical protein
MGTPFEDKLAAEMESARLFGTTPGIAGLGEFTGGYSQLSNHPLGERIEVEDNDALEETGVEAAVAAPLAIETAPIAAVAVAPALRPEAEVVDPAAKVITSRVVVVDVIDIESESDD